MGHVAGRVAIRAGALTTILLAAAPVFCQTALLIDSSGSVKPYYENHLFASLGEDISAAAANSNLRLFSFDVQLRPLPSLQALTLTHFDTYLDRALRGTIDQGFQIVWIVTDNIQDDPRDPVAYNTAAFYAILRGSAVKRVTILPLPQAPGQSGIVIYGIVLADSAAAEFDRQLETFLGRLKGRFETEPLLMKPLDENTVDAPPVTARQSRIYDEGSEIVLSLEIRFRSKLQHLRIVDTHIAPVSVEPAFAPGSLLQPDRRATEIRPDRIQTLDPEGETAEIYTVNVNLGKVRLKKDLGSLFKAAWGGKSIENVTLNVPVDLEVPAGHFRFRDNFVDRYNAPTIDTARLTGKVYAIENLPPLLSSDLTDVKVNVPVTFRVRYPWYPIPVTMALGLLGLAVLAALGWGAAHAIEALRGNQRWSVAATTEYGQSLGTVTREDGMVMVEGDAAGVIHKGRFVPAEGAELVESDGRISGETPMMVKIGRRTALLRFAAAGAPASGTPSEPDELTYR
jgi:hypothetical protein